jgi:mRNA interferase MazF
MLSLIGTERKIRPDQIPRNGARRNETRDMKRGEIWTAAGGKDYAGKPRPVVILQDDRFDMTDSVTVCAFTTDPTDAPLFRLRVEPNESNGLRAVCRLMVDKITTVPKARIGVRIGRLDDEDIVRLNRAAVVFLGIAAPRDDK